MILGIELTLICAILASNIDIIEYLLLTVGFLLTIVGLRKND